jgi:hypothetical protein
MKKGYSTRIQNFVDQNVSLTIEIEIGFTFAGTLAPLWLARFWTPIFAYFPHMDVPHEKWTKASADINAGQADSEMNFCLRTRPWWLWLWLHAAQVRDKFMRIWRVCPESTKPNPNTSSKAIPECCQTHTTCY